MDADGPQTDRRDLFVLVGFFLVPAVAPLHKKKTGTSLLARRPPARRQCQSVVDLSGAIDFSENDTSHQPCPCQLDGVVTIR